MEVNKKNESNFPHFRAEMTAKSDDSKLQAYLNIQNFRRASRGSYKNEVN